MDKKLLGATLLGAPGITTSNKKLRSGLVALLRAERSDATTRGSMSSNRRSMAPFGSIPSAWVSALAPLTKEVPGVQDARLVAGDWKRPGIGSVAVGQTYNMNMRSQLNTDEPQERGVYDVFFSFNVIRVGLLFQHRSSHRSAQRKKNNLKSHARDAFCGSCPTSVSECCLNV